LRAYSGYAMMMAVEINVLVDPEFEGCLDTGWLEGIAGEALTVAGAAAGAELGLVIAGGERVRRLNRDYRGRDEPTDVLAFFMLPGPEEESPPFVSPPDGLRHLGEVIISYPQAVKQAGERGHSIKRELTILIIHGVLHLLGYDDEEPEPRRLMSAREGEILKHIEGNSGPDPG